MIFKQKDKLHNSLIALLPEACFLFGEDGKFEACNEAAQPLLKLLSYGPSRKPDHFEAFVQVLRFTGKAQAGGPVTLGESKYVTDVIGYEDGQILRLFPLHEDEHMARMSKSLEILPWGLITLDLSGEKPQILFCNPKAGAMLGLAHTNMIGMPIQHVFRVVGMNMDVSLIKDQKEMSHHDFEGKIDGSTRWLRFHSIPYTFQKPWMLMVIEDITEEKIREGQFIQAHRLEALGQLAGGVAHDFNNILSIIDGYARMGRKSVPAESDSFVYMEHISKAVQRGAALTGQLLTFGRHKISKERVVDLGNLVSEQMPLIQPLMDASIALSINTEEDVFVEIPPDDVCQILLNLCINARDAMPSGGNLIIEVRRTNGDRAMLQIIDTGEGIPPEIMPRIFDPFFTTKDQGKGTGLGLSMVYGLVKDMGGTIEVNSKPGHGTIFTISLPLTIEKPSTHEMIETPDGKFRLEGFTAMVAEDEPSLLDLVSGMMEEMGAKVLKASNGNEALRLQEEFEGDIDFLLTDVVMPELNGVRLAELFKQSRPESQVLFMSGYPAQGQMARVSLPKDAFLMPKPLDFEKLRDLVKSMVLNQNDNMKERWKTIMGQWKIA